MGNHRGTRAEYPHARVAASHLPKTGRRTVRTSDNPQLWNHGIQAAGIGAEAHRTVIIRSDLTAPVQEVESILLKRAKPSRSAENASCGMRSRIAIRPMKPCDPTC